MDAAEAPIRGGNGAAPDMAHWPYRFEVLAIKHLFIAEYQRPLTSFVEEIEKDYNPALVGTLCVSERSKTRFAVIDGQTRAEGMRRHGETHAPCLVYFDLQPEDEAALFALFQTKRRGMSSGSRFMAQVYAKDPHAVEINEVVQGLGFEISCNSAAPNAIAAVAALEYVYHGARVGKKARETRNPELLAKVLETIKTAWPTLPDTAKHMTMIRGLGYYLVNEGRTADLDKLAIRLGKVTPTALAKRAQSLREGEASLQNSPAFMARAIEAQYHRPR